MNIVAKRTGRKFRIMKKARVALNVLQKGVNEISEGENLKINRDVLKKIRLSGVSNEGEKCTILSRVFKAEIFTELMNWVLLNKVELKNSDALRKLPINNLILNESIDSPRAIVISVVKEVLNNLPKPGLISPLFDSGAASIEVFYLVLKGKMTKRDALNHLIKEATGTINSSVAVLGTLLIHRALSYVPTPGRIAILVLAKTALKKFRNR